MSTDPNSPSEANLAAAWRSRWRLQSSVIGAALFMAAIAAFNLLPGSVSATERAELEFLIFTIYSALLAWALFRSGRRDARFLEGSARLIERLPAGIALVGRSDTIEFANSAFLDLLRAKPEDLTGRRVEEVPGLESLVSMAGRARQEGMEAGWMERVRLGKPGTARIESFAGALRLNPNRPEDGFFLFVQEATETLHLRHESQRHRNVSEFLMDAVTHELSNSLQVVQGLSEMADLEACRIQCQGRMPCQTASAAARRASGIVSDVKRLALLERFAEEPLPTSLHDLIVQAIEGAAYKPTVRVAVHEPPWARTAAVAAGPLASFGLSKLIEEAASRAGPAAAEVVVTVGEPLWGPVTERAVLEVRAYEVHAVNEGRQGRVDAPARTGAPDLQARTPLRLALAAAIFEQQGWFLISSRTEGETPQTLYQLSVLLLAPPVPAPAVRLAAKDAPGIAASRG